MPTSAPTSVFAGWSEQFWQYRYNLTLDFTTLQGGQPVDPRIVKTLIRQRLGFNDEELLAQAVGEIRAETNQEATPENVSEAAKSVESKYGLNVFRCDDKGLFLGGYALKAAIKEAVSIARAANNLPEKYGATRKGIISYTAEHIGVVEDKLYIERDGRILKEADETQQKIVHANTPRGKIHSLKYVEVVTSGQIHATIETDTPFTDQEWAVVWMTGERQGIGAGRSGSAGRYVVTQWERINGNGGNGKRRIKRT
jgi:hypothetical protein